MLAYLILRGYPGSGKTTLLNSLPIINVIDPDHTSLALASKIDKIDAKKIKYRYNLKQALALLNSNRSFVWVQQWSKISGIDLTIENISLLAHSPAILKPVVVCIKVPFVISYYRYFTRIKNIGDNRLNFIQYYQKIVKNFDNGSINGASNYTILNLSFSQSKLKLQQILEYEQIN